MVSKQPFSAQGSKIIIGAFNIHGLRDKMDNMLVLQWIYLHDIVFLSEIKYNRKFNVPGYKTVLGSHTYGTHGGVAILFRNHIFE